MPTSKKRSGWTFWNLPSDVPDGIAAVMPTMRSSVAGELDQRVARKHPDIFGGGGGAPAGRGAA